MMLSKFSVNLPVVPELPEEQITSAKNLNTSIQEIVLEAIKSVDKPNIQNGVEKKGLILESNLFVENINALVFRLQNVVADLEDGTEEKQDLVQVISKLTESSYAILNEINKNPEELKIKLKDNLEKVATVSADLVKIIEKNKLGEKGQILLLGLGDLQHAVDFVKIRNEVLNESPDKIKEFLKDAVVRICNSISTVIFQTSAPAVHRIIDSVNSHCRHLEGVVEIFLKQHGGQYAEDIRQLMTDTCKELNQVAVQLQKLYNFSNDVPSLINLVRENVNRRCEVIAKLICALDIGKVVGTVNENLASSGPPEIMSYTMKIRH